MGEGTRCDSGRISFNQSISERGVVWTDEPNEEILGFDRSQHRRGMLPERGQDFARFLQMAAGSAGELEYHVLLARDLGLLNPTDYQRLSEETTEVKRMLAALLQKLRADS